MVSFSYGKQKKYKEKIIVMKATCEETSPTVTKINIEVPEETVTSMLDQRYRELTKTAKIAGFRKGKIPKSILVSKYQTSVTADVLNTLIPDTISVAISEKRLRSVSRPIVDKIKFTRGQPLSFEATVEVIPKIKLKDFRGMELSCEIETLGDDAVDKALGRLRDSSGVLETADSKVVEQGNHLVIDYKCKVDGREVPRLAASNVLLLFGSNTLFEGLERGMADMKKGETREIALKLPETSHMKGIAGKEAVFAVTVNEIKRKKLPELDDEFAKQLGKGETLQELKSIIRIDLEKNNRNNAMMKVKQKLLDRLVEENPVDIPDSLRKAETARLLDKYRKQAVPEDEQITDEEELKIRLEKQAVHSLSREMLIDSFTEEHFITLSENELSEEISRMAERLGESPQVYSKKLKENKNTYANFEQRLLNEKTLDVMLEYISIKEVFVIA